MMEKEQEVKEVRKSIAEYIKRITQNTATAEEYKTLPATVSVYIELLKITD